MAEAGYPQYAVSVWYGVAAQSKLPDEIAQKLKASLDRALSDDTFRASLDKSGFAPLRPKSFADIEKFIGADRKLWAGVIKELNISLD
jgi:tripartite-type tricarboxylate transporter receptor subunit TctC